MPARGHQLVVGPEVAPAVDLGGLGVVFKVEADQTSGTVSIVEHPMEPGRLVPPHVHKAEDEISYVLEGRFGVRIGDMEQLVGPGSYVVKPRRIPHTFWNPGPEPGRLIEVIVPAGLERFFQQLGTWRLRPLLISRSDELSSASNTSSRSCPNGSLSSRRSTA